MIIFFGDGRLGNQLFQYAFVKSFAKEHELILSNNFADLIELFELPDNKIINISNKGLMNSIARKIFVPILRVLSRLHLISSAKVKMTIIGDIYGELLEKKYMKGLFPITFIYPGYFQSIQFFDEKKIQGIEIKSEYLTEAKNFLQSIPPNHKRIFVHIRRGDIIGQTRFGKKDNSLPLKYYTDLILSFQNMFENPYFIFLSDDLKFVEENFKEISNKLISKNTMNVDFSIMTLCDAGILSNSSFSWWGAYLAKNGVQFYAPKSWVGFKSGVEFPIGITPPFATMIDLKEDE